MLGVAGRLVGGPVALGFLVHFLAPLVGAYFHAVDHAVLCVSPGIRGGPFGLRLFLHFGAPLFAAGLRAAGGEDQGCAGEDEVFHNAFQLLLREK